MAYTYKLICARNAKSPENILRAKIDISLSSRDYFYARISCDIKDNFQTREFTSERVRCCCSIANAFSVSTEKHGDYSSMPVQANCSANRFRHARNDSIVVFVKHYKNLCRLQVLLYCCLLPRSSFDGSVACICSIVIEKTVYNRALRANKRILF